MNAVNEMAANLETNEHQSASIRSGSRDEFDKFDEQVRAAVKDFQRAGDHWKSVDEQNHLLLIDRRLDHETSERRAIYYRLVATEREMKRQGSLKSVGYLVATCIVVAAILAWQSYGDAAKQIVATRIPEFGWSQQTKQVIAGWMQQIGWWKPVVESKAEPVTQTAPETVAPKAPTALTLDPVQVQQMVQVSQHCGTASGNSPPAKRVSPRWRKPSINSPPVKTEWCIRSICCSPPIRRVAIVVNRCGLTIFNTKQNMPAASSRIAGGVFLFTRCRGVPKLPGILMIFRVFLAALLIGAFFRFPLASGSIVVE